MTTKTPTLRRIALAASTAAVLLGGCGGAAPGATPAAGALNTVGVTGVAAPGSMAAAPAAAPELAVPPPVAAADPARVHALLINGGGRASTNQWSHVEHIDGMVDVLEARGIARERISIFSADGVAGDSDVITRGVRAPTSGDWLLAGTELGEDLEPRRRLLDTDWSELLPAELARRVEPARKAELRAWFEKAAKTLEPGDTLLLYTTDHGLKGRDGELDNGALALWGEELDVREMRQMLDLLDPRVQVVVMMSQCYSGTFAAALLPAGASDDGDAQACGLFSVPADRPAFGCFPEGKARGEMGHGYALIRALETRTRLDDAHHAVVRDDLTPDVPVRTSDILVERMLGGLADERRQSLAGLVDAQLEAARERTGLRGTWNQLAAVADAHGLSLPADFAGVAALEQELTRARDELEGLRDYWLDTRAALAEANLARFLDAHPDWRDRLEPRALEPLDDEGLDALHAELAAELERDTRANDPRLHDDLAHFHAQARAADEASWRTKVRIAGAARLRIGLLELAARELLEQGEAGSAVETARETLAELQACEAFAPGVAPEAERGGRVADTPPLVDHGDDTALAEQLRPARLGVSFASAEGHAAGAVRVREVSPRSVADRAGLREGDIVLGPPDAPFVYDADLRRWVLTAPRNEPLELVVLRDEKKTTLTVELE